MTDYSKLTVGDVTQGIAQTKAALKRAQELIAIIRREIPRAGTDLGHGEQAGGVITS